jgi:4'-phosphopantetheinyl transferase
MRHQPPTRPAAEMASATSGDMNITSKDFKFPTRLLLPENNVHLWRIDLAALRTEEFDWTKTLSSDEAARAGRFRFPVDHHRYAATRGLLRKLLAGYLSADPLALNFSYSAKEKPSLSPPYSESGITFNISHSGGVSLLAFTRKREIGVDVEEVRTDFEVDTIARRFFSSKEREQLVALPREKRFEAFFRCWTQKEAYIKATGDGLSLPLSQFDVSIIPDDRDALIATRPDALEAAEWSMREVPAGPAYVAALCVRGRGWILKDWTNEPG